MASIGMADTLILMVLALVVFGPRRLPQIGRQLGRLMYEFRKASNDFKFQMEEELRQAEEADRREREELEQLKALTALPAADSTGSAPRAPEFPGLPAEPLGSSPEPSAAARPDTPEASPYPGELVYPDLAGENAAAAASAKPLAPGAAGENAGSASAAAPSEPSAHHG